MNRVIAREKKRQHREWIDRMYNHYLFKVMDDRMRSTEDNTLTLYYEFDVLLNRDYFEDV